MQLTYTVMVIGSEGCVFETLTLQLSSCLRSLAIETMLTLSSSFALKPPAWAISSWSHDIVKVDTNVYWNQCKIS